MVRTVLRGRSGDLVTAVQLADRTGIVAASAPPAVSAAGPAEPDTAPRFRGEGMRGIRRNVLFTCSAALFLVVGWVGGGAFGHQDVEQTPAVAAGVVSPQDQVKVPDNPPAPVTTSEPPKPASAPPPAPKQRARKQSYGGATRASRKPETTSSSPASVASQPRADLLGNTATAALQAPLTGLAQFQQLMNAWTSGQNYPGSYYGPVPPCPLFTGR